ncbi:hypothetical protein B0H13DRAFT_2375235 [Mycena leptocephala]|nr:hypothetical protein B0H13DRAFT_2375235 [Mycena leptocephala]
MAMQLASPSEQPPEIQASTPADPVGTTSRRELQEGMDRGFALSPMADLVLAYNHHQDDEYSLFRRVNTLSSKKALDISEIIDRGVSIIALPVARFGLETGFLLRTDRTIKEMQALLTQAAGLIRERTSCFQIDPHAVISRVLRSAHDLGELHSAWVAMSERLDLAQRNFLKYQTEYRAEVDTELLLSPVSTNPDVYAVFPRENTSLATDLNYIYDNVPHMKKLWPKEYKVETDFLPDVMRAPSYLKGAFPDRPSEFRPSTIYYSAEGERKEIVVSSRSSHGAGAGLELPPETRGSKGKGRAMPGGVSPNEEAGSRPTEEENPRRAATPGHWNLSDASQGILGTEIPYKDSSSFFVPRSPRRFAPSAAVPGPGLPNPIFGMATSGSYFGGDSISQARRPAQPDLMPKPTLSRVEEIDEEIRRPVPSNHTSRSGSLMLPLLQKTNALLMTLNLGNTSVGENNEELKEQGGKEETHQTAAKEITKTMAKDDVAEAVTLLGEDTPDEALHLLIVEPPRRVARQDLRIAVEVKEAGTVAVGMEAAAAETAAGTG